MQSLPIDLAEYALTEWTKTDFEELEHYRYNIMSDKFHETLRLGPISIDEDNCLFKLEAASITYDILYLKEYTFTLRHVKDVNSLLKGKCELVDLELTLANDLPRFKITIPVMKNIKITREINPESDITEYLPLKAKNFVERLGKMTRTSREVKMAKYTITPETLETEIADTTKEILKALRVMGYETLTGVSLKGLARRKAALLKPGKVLDIEYIRDVNRGYEILKQVIEERNKNED